MSSFDPGLPGDDIYDGCHVELASLDVVGIMDLPLTRSLALRPS
jgi:hypothetical protein